MLTTKKWLTTQRVKEAQRDTEVANAGEMERDKHYGGKENVKPQSLKSALAVPWSLRSGDLSLHWSCTTAPDVTLRGGRSGLGCCYGLKCVPLKSTC